MDFEQAFPLLTGYAPLRWQSRLFEEYFKHGTLPRAVDVPTGLGKTAVMALWLIARAQGACLPRRLVYVVDRRAVVDQATEFAVALRQKLDQPQASALKSALGLDDRPLPIATLRGQHVDNREWLTDPSLPAIVVGTVDMIGSRLLFEGYGVSRGMRPYQAGLLGADALVLIDESHLVPPFEALLVSIAENSACYGATDPAVRDLVPAFRVLTLSATSRTSGENVFRLDERDYRGDEGSDACTLTRRRLFAGKRLTTVDAGDGGLVVALAREAWHLAFPDGRPASVRAQRIVVFCDRREDAEKVKADLDKRAAPSKRGQAPLAETELLVGARRVRERELAAKRLNELGFLAGSQVNLARPAFLVATSAGEVGVDLDADHMVCDLVAWERMVQRFGRVNRRGDGDADVVVVLARPNEPKIGKPEPPGNPPIEPLKPEPPPRNVSAEEREAYNLQNLQYRERLAAYRKELKSYEGRLKDYEKQKREFDAAWRDCLDFDAKRDALKLLASDASPANLLKIAQRAAAGDKSVCEVLRRATSEVPLRPALTRPLVDAWAMTSLREHTGRPEVQPWLRGWVDEKPQTSIVWRKHLPVRPPGQPAATPGEIETFFEAAPPHVSEVLETETFRVVEWLQQRARRLLGKGGALAGAASSSDAAATAADGAFVLEKRVAAEDEQEGDEDVQPTQRLGADALVGFVLTGSGKFERGLRLRDLVVDAKQPQETIETTLAGRTLLLHADFGGLSADGLVDVTADTLAAAADDESVTWIATDNGRPAVTYRVRANELAAEEQIEGGEWHLAHVFTVERNAEGEPTRVLTVETWRDAATTEDARAAGPVQTLEEHQSWAEQRAQELGKRLGLPDRWVNVLALAARLHDEGKRALRWQEAFNAPPTGGPYAKTPGPIRQNRLEGYRHEFGSLPYAERNEAIASLPEDQRDLVLHLIAAHHGYARPLIPVDGCDDAPPSMLQERAREVALRFARLQRRWGPWGLAWWEALLRAADQQASRENEERGRKPRKGA